MRNTAWVMAALMTAALPGTVQAGIYSDDLAKCLVSHSTDAEKTAMMQWMFAAMSAHPAVAALTKVTPGQRSDFNRRFATIVQELVTVRCRTETVAALKNEGPPAFQTSFGVLGQVAMRGLMNDAAVVAQLSQLETFADERMMSDVYKEAGITVPAKLK